MWSEFGISGDLNNLKNYTVHPMSSTRKLFFFSDAPHLIKNVRNKLHDKKLLRVIKKYIDRFTIFIIFFISNL